MRLKRFHFPQCRLFNASINSFFFQFDNMVLKSLDIEDLTMIRNLLSEGKTEVKNHEEKNVEIDKDTSLENDNTFEAHEEVEEDSLSAVPVKKKRKKLDVKQEDDLDLGQYGLDISAEDFIIDSKYLSDEHFML